MGKKTVCVDLDGTLAFYDGWKGIDNIGDPLPGAREFLSRLIVDYDVVIYTTRCNEEVNKPEKLEYLTARVGEWLVRHQLPFTSIHVGQGKPIAIAYVDDRSVMVRENVDWTTSYADLILRFVDELAKRKAVTTEE